jgi:hypothetical protein
MPPVSSPEQDPLDAKRARLARLIQQRLQADADGFALSEGQKAIWSLGRTSANPSLFNTFFAAQVQGRLDLPCLAEAVALLVQRHPSLRTVFAERDG